MTKYLKVYIAYIEDIGISPFLSFKTQKKIDMTGISAKLIRAAK